MPTPAAPRDPAAIPAPGGNPVQAQPAATHTDVVVVGAGLSGIGAAVRLQTERPGTSYVVLEARHATGGTWDLFRYPGVRSDSDMATLSYPWRPWEGRTALADGPEILDYLRGTARDHDVERHIRLGHRVTATAWSSADALWRLTVEVTDPAGGTTTATRTCRFLYLCSGYYDYARGHTPDFPGVEDFRGDLVHPQAWPEDLDTTDRRVLVIGSGATAVTLVPALVREGAGLVTMLQRSATYMTALPRRDPLADAARRVLPPRVVHRLVRAKNVALGTGIYQLCRRRPRLAASLLRKGVLRHVGDPDLVAEHFTPTYDPWDQRLCVVPGADLFRAVARGDAEVVTDHVDRFVPEGVRLASGRVVEADVVVTATGLTLLPLGGIALSVDGEPVDVGRTWVYRGVLLSGLPNLAVCVGYTNASWTLRADLSSRYVCRLLGLLDTEGYAAAWPEVPPGLTERPLLDLTSGYVRRAADCMPKQGTRAPWTVRQNYPLDVLAMARADLTEDMRFLPRDAATGGGAAAPRPARRAPEPSAAAG